MTFKEHLKETYSKNNSYVCVGLDSDISRMPDILKDEKLPQFEFNKAIIDATRGHVLCYKPNMAFYESQGLSGIESLIKTMEYINGEIPVVIDCKRGDIGNTSSHYAKAMFDIFKCGAVTLSPYMGIDALTPFLEYKDKFVFSLCRTSNPNSDAVQNQIIEGRTLYEIIAEESLALGKDQVGLVMGATKEDELRIIREKHEDAIFLIPGIGAQGGSIEPVIKYGKAKDSQLMVVNSSRGIIFKSSGADFAEVAHKETIALKSKLNQ